MNKRGVSLVTLVLTIIILVILSGVIIVSINNNAVIDEANKAASKQNQVQAQQVASLAFAEKVMDGVEDLATIKAYIEASLVANDYNLDDYKITVTQDGANVVAKDSLIWDSNGNVQEIVDGVPIPTGFVASSVAGENTKAGGLVIYEGTKSVTATNHAEALRTRNQFVWVPVEDMADFVRDDYGVVTLSNTPGTGIWEIELGSDNKPKNTQDANFITEKARKEAIAMYDSVEKYGGFYVARYEAGLDESNIRGKGTTGIVKSLTNVHSKMNKIPYNYIGFSNANIATAETGGIVEVARSLYPESNAKYGVVSTLMYGVQWDRILSWWLETSAVASVTDSSTYGNYNNNELAFDTFNEGAKYTTTSDSATPTYTKVTDKKSSGASWLLTTGATEEARVNNIYDMAGNVDERTMEGYSTQIRMFRGGNFYYGGGQTPVSNRKNNNYPTSGDNCYGFRPTLYIKY